MKDYTPEYTPVHYGSNVYYKRDDMYAYAGIRGGKVRSCRAIAAAGVAGAALVTASARKSPQMQIVARIAARLGVPCRCHTASGATTPEMADAAAHGAVVVQWRPGYNSVICARAVADVSDYGGTYVPFGMECMTAIRQTAGQVANLPFGEFKRIVVVMGSGMTACGILSGLLQCGRGNIPVLGVRIGADPRRRLANWAPPFSLGMLDVVSSPHPYTKAVAVSIGGVLLNPHYEAKCVEFLKPGDLFWIVGIRAGLEDK